MKYLFPKETGPDGAKQTSYLESGGQNYPKTSCHINDIEKNLFLLTSVMLG